MFNITPTLIAAISEKLNHHHQLYPIIKVRDYLWEYILVQALSEVDQELRPSWDYGSQKIGKDITLADGTEISCKSGQIHADNRIKISSSRLSRISDREGIKRYLATTKTDDYIACLSTRKNKKSLTFDGDPEYCLSIFRSDVIDYQSMKWELFGKDDNLRGFTDSGITVTVTEAMGWQVWYYLPCELAEVRHTIKVPSISVGDGALGKG